MWKYVGERFYLVVRGIFLNRKNYLKTLSILSLLLHLIRIFVFSHFPTVIDWSEITLGNSRNNRWGISLIINRYPTIESPIAKITKPNRSPLYKHKMKIQELTTTPPSIFEWIIQIIQSLTFYQDPHQTINFKSYK